MCTRDDQWKAAGRIYDQPQSRYAVCVLAWPLPSETRLVPHRLEAKPNDIEAETATPKTASTSADRAVTSNHQLK
jgi:hypothetical protein